MVTSTHCHFCGITTSTCFGSTNEQHKEDCPMRIYRHD